MSTPLNWLAAALLCIAIGSGHLLDGPDDHSFEILQAQEIEAAQRAEADAQAFERAAQLICGANSGWLQQADGALRCTTKHGTPTGVLLAGAGQ